MGSDRYPNERRGTSQSVPFPHFLFSLLSISIDPGTASAYVCEYFTATHVRKEEERKGASILALLFSHSLLFHIQ